MEEVVLARTYLRPPRGPGSWDPETSACWALAVGSTKDPILCPCLTSVLREGALVVSVGPYHAAGWLKCSHYHVGMESWGAPGSGP